MARQNLFLKYLNKVLHKYFSSNTSLIDQNSASINLDHAQIKNILIVRLNLSFGELIPETSLFRAIKEKSPSAKITLITEKQNYEEATNIKFIDEVFAFRLLWLLNPFYVLRLKKTLKQNYDIVLVPAIESFSFVGNMLAGLSLAKLKIGVSSIDDANNESSYVFNNAVVINWKRSLDLHISERVLEVVRPFGYDTTNYSSELIIDQMEIDKITSADDYNYKEKVRIVIHPATDNPVNQWAEANFIALIKQLNENYNALFCFIGQKHDVELIEYLKKEIPFEVSTFINEPISKITAFVSLADLFISGDTCYMQIAGAVSVPQISIFGLTNPFTLAPFGKNKIFFRKTEFVDDITPCEVYTLCEILLNNKSNIDL